MLKGKNCELTDYCVTQPCRNTGTCHALQDGYKCSCPGGFRGNVCQEDVNECDEIPDLCKNEGQCQNTIGNYR